MYICNYADSVHNFIFYIFDIHHIMRVTYARVPTPPRASPRKGEQALSALQINWEIPIGWRYNDTNGDTIIIKNQKQWW